ncbi:hypothetical protein HDV00_003310 [Rhizophlyctis rosea]|nr:hypothetical protein HDV00_003310 [Rhizophlyctis rosea]
MHQHGSLLKSLTGGILGALTGGHLATLFGRRNLILYNNITFIIGGLLLSMGQNNAALCLGRFAVGVGSGVGTVTLPLYIAEISPVSVRGALGSVNQLTIVTGVFAAGLAGVFMSTPALWRRMFAMTMVPSLLQAILLPLCVESPRWLLGQGFHEEAKAALLKLRGDAAGVGDEMSSLLAAEAEEDRAVNNARQTTYGAIASGGAPTAAERITTGELFRNRALIRPLVAACGLQVAQQLSGINAAVYYSTTIFSKTYPADTAIQLTLLISIVNLLSTIGSSLVIERVGRRTLLLVSEVGMALSAAMAVLAIRINLDAAYVVVSLMSFVAAFGVGLGGIPWLILPELIPTFAIGPASSICTSLNWSSSFLLALFLPIGLNKLGFDIFILFSVLLFLFAGFTYVFVPETKGRTADEIVGIRRTIAV